MRENTFTCLKKCPSVCNIVVNMCREERAGMSCDCLRRPFKWESVFSFIAFSEESWCILSRFLEYTWISVFLLVVKEGMKGLVDILRGDLLFHSLKIQYKHTHLCTHTHSHHRLQYSPRCNIGNAILRGFLGGLTVLTEITLHLY